jgi:glycosyltransferase 2 family protein
MNIARFLRRGEVYAVILVALSIAAFASVSVLGDGEKLHLALGRIHPDLIVMLLGLALVNYFLRALRFQMFARHLGIRVPFRWMLVYYVAGFAMSATPGKVGEFLRLWLIRRRHGFSIERGLPLQIGDRLTDVIASVVLCIAAAGAFSGYWVVVLAAAGIVILGVAMLMRPTLCLASIDVAYRLVGRSGRLFARIRRMVRMTSRLFTPKLLLPALLLGIVGWGAECLALDICMQTITGIGGLDRATFIFTFSNLAGGLTFLPGGVGSIELSIVAFLVSLGSQFEAAATATALIRVTTLWFGVSIGLVALLAVARPLLRTAKGAGDAALVGTEERLRVVPSIQPTQADIP